MNSKRIYLSPPHLGKKELDNVQDSIQSNWISTVGDSILKFEKLLLQYTNAPHCLVVNSGTSAIHLALQVLGIKKGDDVLCSTFTFVATANPIVYQGATPIFIDSEPETWNMSPQLLKEAIENRIKLGKKPKAIILVHLYGMPAKIDEIFAIASSYEIPIIEDAAESLGSTYNGKMTGTFGAVGIYSFNGNKIITTSSGGAIISTSEILIANAKHLANQSRENEIYYEHKLCGYNYRMSNILAAIGCGQMEVIQERITKKREIFNTYFSSLNSEQVSFCLENKNVVSNRWLTTTIFKSTNPEKIRLALEKENIESRPLWKPLHLQPLFKEATAFIDGTSEKLFNNGLCLPSGTAMEKDDLSKIIEIIKLNI